MGSAIPVEIHVRAIYQRRFGPDLAFRQGMWRVLCQHLFETPTTDLSEMEWQP